jgi:hypothetical protein
MEFDASKVRPIDPPNCPTRPSTSSRVISAALTGTAMILAAVLTTSADAQIVSRYSPDFATGQFSVTTPRFSSDTQQLVDEIKQLIEEAERARAADPLFLQDLRAAADRFLWPWRNIVLTDDFADGDFTDAPQWLNPGGFVSVDNNVGLILDGTSSGVGIPGGAGGVPPGFTASNKDRWAGSARSFDFEGADIESPRARRAIRMEDSLEGDFTFRFQVGDFVSSTATIGLYPADSDRSFRVNSGTGGLDRMSESWWMLGDGVFWEGNQRQSQIDVQPGDVIEFRRSDDRITVSINGASVHDFFGTSSEPVRALIAQSGTSTFNLNGVSCAAGGNSGGDLTFRQASASDWDGSVSAFTFVGDDILGETPSNAIRTIDTFTGNFRALMTLGAGFSKTATRIGFYSTQEDIRFDPRDQAGGMREMTNSWYLLSDAVVSGCCSEASIDISKGDTLEFRRDGETISVLVNSQLAHTFLRGSSAPLRMVIGRSNFNFGKLDIDDLTWQLPTTGGGGGSGSGSLEVLLQALQSTTGISTEPLPANNAVVIAPIRVNPAFAISVLILANDNNKGRFEFGVLRRANAFGYRIVINTETLPAVQLIRSDNSGDSVIATSTPPINVADGQAHVLQFTRTQNGIIKLAIDGADFLTATDLRLRSDFDALAMLVQDGLFAVRGITLLDAPF